VLKVKGEKLIGQSKRIAPPPCFLKTFLRGRTFSGGAFIEPKEKHLKKGENLSKLENAFRNHILIPLDNCKGI
jgi:hypothetical protein